MSELRPEVLAFAVAMENQLRRNDWKGGWQGDDTIFLFPRITEELDELRGACFGLYQNRDRVLPEAADVANFCMMVADVAGCLSKDGVSVQTPLQSAALDALAAWIKAEMAKDQEGAKGLISPDAYLRELNAKSELRLAGCALIASLEVTP